MDFIPAFSELLVWAVCSLLNMLSFICFTPKKPAPAAILETIVKIMTPFLIDELRLRLLDTPQKIRAGAGVHGMEILSRSLLGNP